MSQKDLACLMVLVLTFGPFLLVQLLDKLFELFSSKVKYRKVSPQEREERRIRRSRLEALKLFEEKVLHLVWMIEFASENAEYDIAQEQEEHNREAEHYARMNEMKANTEDFTREVGDLLSDIQDFLG